MRKQKKRHRICENTLKKKCTKKKINKKDPFWYNYTGDKYLVRLTVRLGVQLPTCVIWYFATYKDIYKETGFIFGAIGSFIVGLTVIAQTYVSQEPDHGLYMLYFFMIYLFVRIPFVYAFFTTWALYVIFVGAMNDAIHKTKILGAQQNYQLSVIYLTISNVLLTIAAYSLGIYFVFCDCFCLFFGFFVFFTFICWRKIAFCCVRVCL